MRVTVKSINDELARRGITARLTKGSGYFYFQFGEAADWLDRTVRVPLVGSLTPEGWLAEYERLKKVNAQIVGGGEKPKGEARKRARREEPGQAR